jgi:hypothetical protein
MRGLWLAGWLLIGLALLAVAVRGCYVSHRFKARAVVLPGKVVGPAGPDDPVRETNVPVVRFTTPAGETREHRYSAPLAGDAHAMGEDVSILYDARSGETWMDDWSELYLWPALVGFVALLVFLPLIAVGALRLAAWRTVGRASDRAGEPGNRRPA